MTVHASDEIYARIRDLLGIPQDEPIFIFRAQDKHSAGVITSYRATAEADASPAWSERVRRCIEEFRVWQKNNIDKVKVPD